MIDTAYFTKPNCLLYIIFSNYLILTKGADSHILPLVSKGPTEKISKNVTEFSLSGFRTLLICKRLLEPEIGSHLVAKLRAAKTLVNETARKDAIAIVHGEIEKDLQLMGATAVEDKLGIDMLIRPFVLLRKRTVFLNTGPFLIISLFMRIGFQ